MDGELVLREGVISCHRLRSRLGDYPPEYPLVVFTSAQLTSGAMDGIKTYFTTTSCSLLEPHREALRAAVPDVPAEGAPSRSI